MSSAAASTSRRSASACSAFRRCAPRRRTEADSIGLHGSMRRRALREAAERWRLTSSVLRADSLRARAPSPSAFARTASPSSTPIRWLATSSCPAARGSPRSWRASVPRCSHLTDRSIGRVWGDRLRRSREAPRPQRHPASAHRRSHGGAHRRAHGDGRDARLLRGRAPRRERFGGCVPPTGRRFSAGGDAGRASRTSGQIDRRSGSRSHPFSDAASGEARRGRLHHRQRRRRNRVGAPSGRGARRNPRPADRRLRNLRCFRTRAWG